MNQNKYQQNKSSLRRHLLAQRCRMSEAQWRDKSDRLCQHLQKAGLLKTGNTVLAYFSTRQEPDLSPLFRPQDGDFNCRWGFPRCQGKALQWHGWSPSSTLPLQTNRYGITEPHGDAPRIEPAKVDLMLVPAIACDRKGYRLGYGGGFYDRLLAMSDWKAVPTVGIVFAEALLSAVPREPWDQPLQMICTDKGLLSSQG
ncbi:MAG: 5-formyltetrahydrofolate cyclo-ligase [Elainellaceae cyanobacterium]